MATPSAPPVARAAEATDAAVTRIQAFHDALLAVMKEADRLGVQGRFAKLAPVIYATFDLAAMTRIAVGPDWNAMPTADQDALIGHFARSTIATYANRFDGYSGERFEVDPVAAARSTGRLVRTRLVSPKREPVVLNYLLRGAGDAWKVVDIYLAGTISELATRRSEFSAILKSGGAAALSETLHQQADKMLRPPGKSPAP